MNSSRIVLHNRSHIRRSLPILIIKFTFTSRQVSNRSVVAVRHKSPKRSNIIRPSRASRTIQSQSRQSRATSYRVTKTRIKPYQPAPWNFNRRPTSINRQRARQHHMASNIINRNYSHPYNIQRLPHVKTTRFRRINRHAARSTSPFNRQIKLKRHITRLL